MRLAWFAPRGSASDDGFDSAPLVAALRTAHAIEWFSDASAHTFVWMHARQPFDLCIYELGTTAAHRFIWAYPCHYPGLLRVSGDALRASGYALQARDLRQRHSGSSVTQPDSDALRPFFLASRLVVVPDAYLARALERRYPGVRVRGTLPGSHPPGTMPPTHEGPPRVGCLAGARADAVRKAVRRAADLGVDLPFEVFATPAELTRGAEIVVSAPWPPPAGLSRDVLTALSAGRAVVLLETEVTAILPCLDPQTWQARGAAPHPPAAAVSADPRDEEHSLMLALVRLGRDARLRSELAAGARGWWERHASGPAVAAAWRSLIDEAAAVDLAQVAYGKPHGALDGSEAARAILAECGASVDFLA